MAVVRDVVAHARCWSTASQCIPASSKVGTVEGKSITTIEGLTPDQGLHPLQAAFLEHNALQCGFCTPGMIMGAFALLSRVADPTESEIIDGMKGHICRCGAYPRIVVAIKQAAREMLKKEPS